MHDRDLCHDLACFGAEDLGDVPCDLAPTRGTRRGNLPRLDGGLGIALAAGEAARSAVHAGKRIEYLEHLRVPMNRERLGCNRQDGAEERRHPRESQHRFGYNGQHPIPFKSIVRS